MIKFFRKKLRSKKNKLHNSNLLKQLHKDHEQLIKLFTKLTEQPSTKNFDNFMNELKLHLLLEDTNLYESLSHRYSLCKANHLIQRVKDKITEIVPKIEKLSQLIENKASENEINSTLEEIKDYLIKRIELEEEILFDLYKDYLVCGEIEEKLKIFKETHNAEEFLEDDISKN